MVIKNAATLGVTPARKAILEIAEAGLASLDTETVIQNAVRFTGDTVSVRDKEISLSPRGKLLVVGVGKCSAQAAKALEDILGDRITDGIVLDVEQRNDFKKLRSLKGDHPYPTEANRSATAEILSLLSGLTPEDTVIFIISGGGTVLLCQPENHSCIQEKDIVQELFKSGAAIIEMNTVRKHLSRARGGFLAKAAYPAQVLSLIFSDVVGNDISMVASGPTVKDTTTIQEALGVVRRYDLQDNPNFNPGYFIETPKEDVYFEKVRNVLLVSNTTALEAMANTAKNLGFNPTIQTSVLMGEAREVGKKIAQEIAAALPNTVYLYGGETTVTIQGKGKGGRNEELILSALLHIPLNTVIASIASDGVDNSPVAGALCDTLTRTKAKEFGLDLLDHLARNDSFPFFEKVGDQIITGPTGANVSDLIIGLKI